jgi:hypothetical protein
MNLTQRLTEPETIISIVAFIFSLWWIWATLNNRIKELEREMEAIKQLDLDSKLWKIMADLDWLKTVWEKMMKNVN